LQERRPIQSGWNVQILRLATCPWNKLAPVAEPFPNDTQKHSQEDKNSPIPQDSRELDRTRGAKRRLLCRREALLRAEAEEERDEALWRRAPRALAADAMDGGGRGEQRSGTRAAGARRIAALSCGWVGTREKLRRKLNWIRGLERRGSDLMLALVPSALSRWIHRP
jgi:hypothetical protein